MKTKNIPTLSKPVLKSHRAIYKALLRFAAQFDPSDPDLLARGITPEQLKEKRYVCRELITPDVEVRCTLIVKQEGGQP